MRTARLTQKQETLKEAAQQDILIQSKIIAYSATKKLKKILRQLMNFKLDVRIRHEAKLLNNS